MASASAHSYSIAIQEVQTGKTFPGEWLPASALQTAHDQTAFLGLRRGLGPADLWAVTTEEEPIYAAAGDEQISGVRISAGDNGQGGQKTFGLELFAPFAQAQAAQLIQQGLLPKGSKYLYRVRVKPAASAPASPMSDIKASIQHTALPLLEGQLADWQNGAVAVGPAEEGDYPVFIFKEVLDVGCRLCRKPKTKEAGALFLGNLFIQHDPEPEIFAVIKAVIEAKYADQGLFNLDLTAQTYQYLQLQIQRRRQRAGHAEELPLAFGHAHNFTPAVLDDGQSQCRTCSRRDTCQLSSAFYSSQDVAFHQALFSGQPYALGLVWGMTPREEDDLRVFCLDGNQPRQRGYYLISKAT